MRKKMPSALLLEFFSDFIIVIAVVSGIWCWFDQRDIIITLGVPFSLIVFAFTLRVISNIGDILLRFALDVTPPLKYTIPDQLIQNDVHIIQLKSVIEEHLGSLKEKLEEVFFLLQNMRAMFKDMGERLKNINEDINKANLMFEEGKQKIDSQFQVMFKEVEERLKNINEDINKANLMFEEGKQKIDSQFQKFNEILSIQINEIIDNLKPNESLPYIKNVLEEMKYKLEKLENFLSEISKRLDLTL